MSVWRRKALELFPELKDELTDPDNTPYRVFSELVPRCRKAHAQKDEEMLKKIYGYAAWCARQPAKDLWNAAGVSFYEHIVKCDAAVKGFPRWVDADIFKDVECLLEDAMEREKFAKLKSRYESANSHSRKH